MANPEHLAILEKGSHVWNDWRQKNPNIKPDLAEAKLAEVDLQDSILTSADLRNADLRRANLQGARLRSANLLGAKLGGAFMSDINLMDARADNLNLKKAKLHGAFLYRTHLQGANLQEAHLGGSILVGARLRGANLKSAWLNQVDFTGADLSKAELTLAMCDRTIFANVDISTVVGLDTVSHKGPSTIGVDTVYLSQAEIPEVFLRGCGLSDMQIAMVKLHRRGLSNEEVTNLTYDIHNLIVLGAIHSYSSFISYSMNDKAFANKIYDDLQSNGVRCWFAPEDLPIGGKFRDEIDQAISQQDNVILILSEHAVNSGWVEDEVDKAFEVEKERGQRILLPIRLDDSVLESDRAWAKKVCRRLVGDFRNWERGVAYREEFNKLLRGIKATAEGGD